MVSRNFSRIAGITLLLSGLIVSPLWADKTEWIALFDGETLTGWTPNFDDQRVEVRDGIIEMMSVKKPLAHP